MEQETSMMSKQYTTPPKRMLTDMLTSLNTNSEDGCFEALRKIGEWAASEKVNEIVLHLDNTLHDLFKKRLRTVQRLGILPETLTFNLIAAPEAA